MMIAHADPHTLATPRRPFVAPTVVDQGELSDVTRMFSGGCPKGWKGRKCRRKARRLGVLDVPGLDVDLFDDIEDDAEEV